MQSCKSFMASPLSRMLVFSVQHHCIRVEDVCLFPVSITASMAEAIGKLPDLLSAAVCLHYVDRLPLDHHSMI